MDEIEDVAEDYGLDVTGRFTRPEVVDFHLPEKFRRVTAVISVAQTAVGSWVFGYGVKFKSRTLEIKSCLALGEQFGSRSAALRGGVIAIVHWLRGTEG